MSFLLDNLNVIVTIGSTVGVYWMLKKAIKKDIDELKKEIGGLKKEINELRIVVASIDVRLSRLEGEFAERGRWESRGFIGKQQ